MSGRLRLIEPGAVRLIDAAAVGSGIPSFGLMRAAGLAVSRLVTEQFPEARRHVVLCGPGNNGGDGYVAAADLAEGGLPVRVAALDGRQPAGGDAALAAKLWHGKVTDLADYIPAAGDVVIDAIFGAGLARDVPAAVTMLSARLSEAKTPVVAVDMPSGVDGVSGQVLGTAIRAQITITFMARKPGQILLPGRDMCGEVIVADIGIPDRLVAAHESPLQLNHPSLWPMLPVRSAPSHKYAHGHLLVFSGPAFRTGAARLAARAALATGTGLVSIAGTPDALAVHASHLDAIMLAPIESESDLSRLLQDRRIGTAVLGPAFGVRDTARKTALALSDRHLVLDADGISSFAADPEQLFRAFQGDEPRLVLTPHEGEFARLFPDLAGDRSLSKPERAKRAARRSGAVVLLKGADTVIAAPDGRAILNDHASPDLATAGSGDVLAGIIGGLMANHMPAFEAAAAGAWIHGEAGLQLGRGLTAETLVTQIDRAINAARC